MDALVHKVITVCVVLKPVIRPHPATQEVGEGFSMLYALCAKCTAGISTICEVNTVRELEAAGMMFLEAFVGVVAC